MKSVPTFCLHCNVYLGETKVDETQQLCSESAYRDCTERECNDHTALEHEASTIASIIATQRLGA